MLNERGTEFGLMGANSVIYDRGQMFEADTVLALF